MVQVIQRTAKQRSGHCGVVLRDKRKGKRGFNPRPIRQSLPVDAAPAVVVTAPVHSINYGLYLTPFGRVCRSKSSKLRIGVDEAQQFSSGARHVIDAD